MTAQLPSLPPIQSSYRVVTDTACGEQTAPAAGDKGDKKHSGAKVVQAALWGMTDACEALIREWEEEDERRQRRRAVGSVAVARDARDRPGKPFSRITAIVLTFKVRWL